MKEVPKVEIYRCLYKGLKKRETKEVIFVSPVSPGSYRENLPYIGSTKDVSEARVFYGVLRDLIKDKGYEIEIIEGDCMDMKKKNGEVVKHGVDDITRRVIENAIEGKGFPRELYMNEEIK